MVFCILPRQIKAKDLITVREPVRSSLADLLHEEAGVQSVHHQAAHGVEKHDGLQGDVLHSVLDPLPTLLDDGLAPALTRRVDLGVCHL